ncbi:hypothetical protein FQN60_017777 [Etheostoma spectabile]|uniref:Uncharacterized protein n=2 Tax=Etheostoma spectabile TaxID=54343 RepID=A0A5J5DG77_9PERO|nr:hypothetical protein FQN60_017777 [Etheostoma spectabile]
MAEVSLPNVKHEKTEPEPDLEEIKNKDQQLFSLISEGYEILNIRVPSKLPTVDEEESTELQDNLSYLDQTSKIRSRNHHDWTLQQNHTLPEEGEIMHQEPSKQDSADTELRHTPSQKESTSDIDYFEKFTLVDVVVPGEEAPELQEEAEQPAAKPQVEEQKPAKETATDRPSASEDSFVFVTDVEIVGEHLDEVFYGEGAPVEALQRREDNEAESAMRRRRESQRSGKENGSALFGSEETILTPIYISAGPPKIIDLILLEEPTAMSFMYSDLYEDAVGERTKSDGEHSEAESVASEKTYRRRLSDSDEADGYLEKFILKDETPAMEHQPESVQEKREGRMMWSQSEFDTTGCLTRLDREEDKIEETTTQEVSVGDDSNDLQSATFEEKRVIVTETKKEMEEIQLSMGTEEQTVREALEESVQESKLEEDQIEDLEVTREVKRDQTEPPESSTDGPLAETQQVDSKVEKTEQSEDHRREVPPETTNIIETQQPCQTQKVVDKNAQVVVNAAAPSIITEKTFFKEAAADTEMVAADEKVVTEAIAEAPADAKDLETERQEIVISTKPAETTSMIESEQPRQTQKVEEKSAQVVVHAAEETAVTTPVSSEAPPIITEKTFSKETAADTEIVAANEKVVTEAIAEAPAEVKEHETDRQEMLTTTEIESSAETLLCEEKEAAVVVPEDVAPIEVITDCDFAVQALVEVTEKAADEKEIQTQVQIDLREVTSVETTDVHTFEGEEEHKALAEERTVESQSSEFITEADQGSEVKAGISNQVTQPVLAEEGKTDSDKKQLKLLESKQHQKEESVTDNER